jgi:DNA processing protein
MPGACDQCLVRPWLLAMLAAHLERVRARIDSVLELGNHELIAALAGDRERAVLEQLGSFEADLAREHAERASLELICRCDARYPVSLRSLPNAPAVLHVAGGLERFLAIAEGQPVAIVGARRASGYGLEVARSLGRGLARAGVTIVSGMAMGIDSAAHASAIAAGGPTIAVLPGAANRPYPAAKRGLHRQICDVGAAVSELPPGADVWRWMFSARNRIIAALAALTIVVEAGERSGSLITAKVARALGRPVGAVPGRVTSPQAAGTNALLASGGAHIVRGPQDVFDQLFGAGVRAAAVDQREQLAPELRALLSAIADGQDTAAAMARAGVAPERGLQALATLELEGYVRRERGGRFSVLP